MHGTLRSARRRSYGRWGYLEVRNPAVEAGLLAAAIDALYRDQPIIGLPA